MPSQVMLEKWAGEIFEVKIGAGKDELGSRSHVIKAGGEKTLPFLSKEAPIANKPVVAYEIWDIAPQDWPEELTRAYGDLLKDPLSWAEACVKDHKAELLCVRLQGTHPESGNKSPEQAAKFITQLLKKVSVPLVILGSGDDAKDNLVLPLCCQAAKGERCLFGDVMQDNYKTLVAAAMADGHSVIAESPIDVNIAKQLNILISDMGLPLERIVINPTIGALGYGLEYAYSIMERARLAGLAGDKTVASPFICFVAQESWRAKDAKTGSQAGIIWEALTATALIQAGADILVMRHPVAVEKVKKYIDNLMEN